MGAHWRRMSFSHIITDILVNSADTSQIYVSCPDIGVYRSTDSGITWAEFNENLTTQMVLELEQHHLDSSTLYASMNSGAIKKNNDLFTTSIDDLQSGKSPDCILSQNNPNPFDQSTSISYKVLNPHVISLKVYNIFGHEVATLVNDFMYPGIYEIIFTSGNLPGGTYLYSINNQHAVSLKKMIIIK
jgi:hypothetical protein